MSNVRWVLEWIDTKMNQNSDEENLKRVDFKKGFFKKVWYSIYKIEKYSELSAEGFKSAIKYLGLLIMTLCIISSIIFSSTSLTNLWINPFFPKTTSIV